MARRAGQRTVVARRLAASGRLREAVLHRARVAVRRDPVGKAKYQALRARGKTHGSALRSVADRLLAVACAMLRDRTLFDPNRPRCANATVNAT